MLSDTYNKFGAIAAASLMDSLRMQPSRTAGVAIHQEESRRKQRKQQLGHQYMMQMDRPGSLTDLAFEVNDCMVSALLDTGSSETTVSDDAVQQLRLLHCMNTSDQLMMR